jgi:hypothetical protein
MRMEGGGKPGLEVPLVLLGREGGREHNVHLELSFLPPPSFSPCSLLGSFSFPPSSLSSFPQQGVQVGERISKNRFRGNIYSFEKLENLDS